jgi:hypothetical protein
MAVIILALADSVRLTALIVAADLAAGGAARSPAIPLVMTVRVAAAGVDAAVVGGDCSTMTRCG